MPQPRIPQMDANFNGPLGIVRNPNHGETEPLSFLKYFLCVSVSQWFKKVFPMINLLLMQELYYLNSRKFV